MDNRWRSPGKPADDPEQSEPPSEIRTFRLGEVALIEVPAPPARDHELQRTLLWEWATSPAGLLIKVNANGTVDEGTARTITAAAELVRAWPGTPIGVISDSADLHKRIAAAPQGRTLPTGTTMTQVWQGMWSRGVAVNITIELPPAVLAPRTARDTVARACLDWGLNRLAAPAALVTGDLVTRSVIQGAQDIHFTVSRHHSRVRVLVRDDMHSTARDEPQTIDDVFHVPYVTPTLSQLTDCLGEFALDGHHVRWAVMRDLQADRPS